MSNPQTAGSEPIVSDAQLALMRHALGLGRRKRPYRNYFYTNCQAPEWTDLVAKDLALPASGSRFGYPIAAFYLTYAGAKLAYGKPMSEKRFEAL